MTTDEQNAEIGRVVTELKDAKKHHACLVSKSERLADQLQSVAELLLNGPPSGTVNSSSDGSFIIVKDGTATPEYRVPSPLEVLQHVTEVNKIQRNIRRLERQRESFGID